MTTAVFTALCNNIIIVVVVCKLKLLWCVHVVTASWQWWYNSLFHGCLVLLVKNKKCEFIAVMHATTSCTVCNKLNSNRAGCLFRLLSNSLYLYEFSVFSACQWVVVKILKNFPGHQENEAIVFICCLGVESIGGCGNAIPQIKS